MISPIHLSRREALAMLGAAGTSVVARQTRSMDAQQPVSVLERAVMRNDAAVRSLLDGQITDSASRWRGAVPDQFGLHSPGSAGSIAETLTASFLHPRSTFHSDLALVERLRLAAEVLGHAQNPEGNVDLLTHNLNSA